MNAVAQIQEPAALVETPVLTPLAMIDRALSSGASVEVLEKLMALQERYDANQARKAFDAAVASAKGEIGPIVKDREVDFTSQKGRTNYRHESFAGIAKAIGPILDKNGLSYRYRASQEGGRVTVTCVLAHRDGYSEETTLAAGNDTSGNKNDIQSIGSATTYLQRYTLKLALGLSTTDKDDDGNAADSLGLSEAAETALSGIASCQTLEDCTAWHEANAAGLSGLLSERENQTVVRTFNARRKAIRGAL